MLKIMRLPSQLLHRSLKAHKGDFGHVFILAGSARFSGAAAICSSSCIRSGAGLVTLGIPKSINPAMIKLKPKEVMTLPLPETKDGSLSLSAYKEIMDFCKNIDVLVIGPGLTQNRSTQALIRKVLNRIKKPTVIDADALNALARNLGCIAEPKDRGIKEIIMTPHQGEMARLLGTSINIIQKDRENIARSFAKKYRLTLVLKGHNTIVTDYKDNYHINKTGNPGMATAGSGDVLTGIIAAFLAQGLKAFDAAKYGVYLHGLAGDIAAKEKTQLSLIASDIIEKIPQAVKKSF